MLRMVRMRRVQVRVAGSERTAWGADRNLRVEDVFAILD